MQCANSRWFKGNFRRSNANSDPEKNKTDCEEEARKLLLQSDLIAFIDLALIIAFVSLSRSITREITALLPNGFFKKTSLFPSMTDQSGVGFERDQLNIK